MRNKQQVLLNSVPVNILKMFSNEKGQYCSVFRNNHGRIIYLCIDLIDNQVVIRECEYLDRSKVISPKKLVTYVCELRELVDVIRAELDKSFTEVELCDDVTVSKSYLVSNFLSSRKKKILIMIAEGDTLKTIFKSKYRREIYFELLLSDGIATITQCHYVDRRAKGLKIPPQGIVTVCFEFSLQGLLEVINTELEGGFTDAIITGEHTLKLDRPICGSI